jgi:CheY-like chemotaxis protein
MFIMPSKSVLVVDDDKLICWALEKEFAGLGLSVHVVESGANALAELRGQPYDLVFLDIHLPDMNGLELLKQIDRDEKLREAASQPAASGATASVDPLDAPPVPKDRDLPASIFEEKPRQVAKGEWGNDKPIEVLARSLDADRDGAPEEVRYHDQKTGVILRKEEDRDYDGRIDTWVRYDAGIPVAIERDTDGDGKLDEWQSYGRDGRMARREVDRNADGTRDAFYSIRALARRGASRRQLGREARPHRSLSSAQDLAQRGRSRSRRPHGHLDTLRGRGGPCAGLASGA